MTIPAERPDRPSRNELPGRARQIAHQPFDSACYAPFVSLYLDVHGNVLACCQNTTHRLGSVRYDRLIDIWRGEAAARLRAALVDDDFGQGCHFCRWQGEAGDHTDTFAAVFDHFRAESRAPDWPKRLEFSLSNTCNLECVMCRGEFSSAIRSKREHLPPLVSPYGDAFFDELADFLPHLVEARFLGGEPFLARESFRIWGLMIDQGLEVPCHVTTNGTVLTPAVERVLEHLPVSLGVSIDGTTKATVESIRKNASFDQIMANLRRFRQYTQDRGTRLDLTFCLMTRNWQEFGDYLALADEWGCAVYGNTVLYPRDLSLYGLSAAALDEVLAVLEAADDRNRTRLGQNRHVWEEELARLRDRRSQLRHRDGSNGADAGRRHFFESSVDGLGAVPLLLDGAEVPRSPAEAKDLLIRAAHEGVGAIICDDAGEVVACDESFGGVPVDCRDRGTFNDVLATLFEHHGREVGLVQEAEIDGVHERVASFDRGAGEPTYVRSLTFRDPIEPSRLVHVGGVVPRAGDAGTGLAHPSQPVTLRPSGTVGI